MTATPAISSTPVGGSLGARIDGLDLRHGLDRPIVDALRRILLDRLVLFFPDQHLSADDQRVLMGHFGDVEKHPERPRVLDDSDEEVVVVAPTEGVSAVWHCDYDPDFVPCGICSLNMMECAADGGGDTIFLNNYEVYESFSEPMRALLDGLTAVHRNTGNRGRARDEVRYPLVGMHPETGRRGLLYSAHHVQDFVELVPEESNMLLDRLRFLTERPRFAIRHHWQPGTLALWDNRCVQHYAVPDFSGSRLLYQVTVSAPMPTPLPAYAPPREPARNSTRSDVAPRPSAPEHDAGTYR